MLNGEGNEKGKKKTTTKQQQQQQNKVKQNNRPKEKKNKNIFRLQRTFFAVVFHY